MRTTNHRIFPLNFDSLQLLEAPRYGLSTRFPRGIIVAALLLCVTGCGGGGGTICLLDCLTAPTNAGGGTLNTGAAEFIYVVQQPATGNGTILEFSATASGSVSPSETITPDLAIAQVCTDEYGYIYIATSQGISEYSYGVTGNSTPVRTIPENTTTGIYEIDGMAVSPTGEILIGQDGGDVDEWSASQKRQRRSRAAHPRVLADRRQPLSGRRRQPGCDRRLRQHLHRA